MRAFLLLLFLAIPALASDEDDLRKAAAELEAKIVKLKAEGKLPGNSTSSATATAITTATAAAGGSTCIRLKVGEAAIVQTMSDDGIAPTPLGTLGYGLSRPRENDFIAELNVHFEAGLGYDGGLSPMSLNETYRGRVADCLKQYEGLLKNERSGRSLVLRVTDNSAVPAQTIQVMKAGRRANAIEYPSDIPCPVILHESLHLLGLPDEYLDRVPAGTYKMNCRAIGPKDSVMSNQWEALTQTKDHTAVAVVMCKCEKTGDACWALAEKNNGKACPPGTTEFKRDIDASITSSLNVLNSSEAFVLNETKVSNGVAPPSKSSVLYPAHFRVITEPGCMDVNKVYYDCASNAYLSTSAGDECQPKPTACAPGSFKWLE